MNRFEPAPEPARALIWGLAVAVVVAVVSVLAEPLSRGE